MKLTFEGNKLEGVELHIAYRDAEENITERDIIVKEFEEDNYFAIDFDETRGRCTIWAYCKLRKANRNFYAGRIMRAVDLSTGKAIKDIDQFLKEEYLKTEDGKFNEVWKKIDADEIKTIAYIARLSKNIQKEARDIIYDYFEEQVSLEGIQRERMLKSFTDITKTSKQQFALMLGRIAKKDNKRKQIVMDYCTKIVYSKKNPKWQDEKVLSYMRKRLQINIIS